MTDLRSKEITIEVIFENYTKNVKRAARKFVNLRMLYDKWLLEDLIQQGYVGLIEAYKRYDFAAGIDFFWNYARKFVKGRMIDFTIQHFNYIRPSKKINTVMLKIKNQDLYSRSPQYISRVLGCTESIAADAIHFLIMRNKISLFEPGDLTQESQNNKDIIDILPSDENQDDIFQIDILSGSSEIEQKIARMLIDGYSRENIIEHCSISASHLKKIIDEILVRCGMESKKIRNRNEELLMQISNLEENRQNLQSNESGNVEWVKIELISASPKNPRKDLSVNSEQLQEVLVSKGWEEPVTCYKKGHFYVLLAGHRRWNAAKKLGHKRIPVFIVKSPSNPAEEMDRLGSLQSAQVEWTPYENAKNTYDRWIYTGEIAYSQLADKLGISEKRVGANIRVYKYYPRTEIEDKLSNGMYSISMLDYIISWIKRLSHYHPEFVESIGEEFIRQLMLTKYENKCFNSRITNDRYFVTNASSEEVFSFLSDPNKTLAQAEIELMMHRSKENHDSYQKAYAMISKSMDSLEKIECKDRTEAEQLINKLDKLLEEVTAKRKAFLGGVVT
ncbi:ParB N-terminal domain-containing protein [Paenibacillus thiaminolyticus]|uniref:ParB N-terminal domain-containing protein n=1 Tax=Paenibacillus thiaminolyticus TaxID=49283 RepID=UPI0035A6EE90